MLLGDDEYTTKTAGLPFWVTVSRAYTVKVGAGSAAETIWSVSTAPAPAEDDAVLDGAASGWVPLEDTPLGEPPPDAEPPEDVPPEGLAPDGTSPAGMAPDDVAEAL
jgi:hypothetical protein